MAYYYYFWGLLDVLTPAGALPAGTIQKLCHEPTQLPFRRVWMHSAGSHPRRGFAVYCVLQTKNGVAVSRFPLPRSRYRYTAMSPGIIRNSFLLFIVRIGNARIRRACVHMRLGGLQVG